MDATERFVLCLWGSLLSVATLSSMAAQNSGFEGEIIFSSGRYYYNVFQLFSDELTQLTYGNDQYNKLFTPRWSPDGKHIAFTDSEDVYLMDSNGSNLIRVTTEREVSDRYIDWSPDGRTIAIASIQENMWRIRILDMDTLNIVNATQNDTYDGQFGLTWSPDGEYIVFTSNRNLNGDGTGLYELEVDTGEVSPLQYLDGYVYRSDRYPRWSPAGGQIAFLSDIDNTGGGWNIYLTDSEGSYIQQLTNRTNAPEASGSIFFGLSWSPNGSRIVFTSCPTVLPESCNLYSIGIDGTGFIQLTDDDETAELDPDWKPEPVEVDNDEVDLIGTGLYKATINFPAYERMMLDEQQQ